MEGILVSSDATILFKSYLKHRDVDKKQARALVRHLIVKTGSNVFNYTEFRYIVTDTGFKYDNYRITHKVDSLGRARSTVKKVTSCIFNIKSKKFYVKHFTHDGVGERIFKRLTANDVNEALFSDILIRHPKLSNAISLHINYCPHAFHLLDDLYFNEYNNARQVVNTSYTNTNPFINASGIYADGYTDVTGIVGNNYHKLKNLDSKTLNYINPNQKLISTALMLGIDKIDLKDRRLKENLCEYIGKVSSLDGDSDSNIKLQYDPDLVGYINNIPEFSLVRSINDDNIDAIRSLRLVKSNSLFVFFNGEYFSINFKGRLGQSVSVETAYYGNEKILKDKVMEVCYIIKKSNANLKIDSHTSYSFMDAGELPF